MTGSAATFLWGPRQTGKTTLLRQRFPQARFYDLLDTDLQAELLLRPHRLREEVLAERPELVVVDEVQKAPRLLDEIHWLLENTATTFVLCGSSARKLRRGARDLLGGRAIDCALFPLTTDELGTVDLDKLLNHGGLPAHYLSPDPSRLLKAYANNYLKEEIIDEAVTRNIPAFAHFLEIVGLTHGKQLNYTNTARESGVSASTVRSYYQILKDTLLGFELPPWRRKRKRRLVETAKFYLFDVGLANHLIPELRTISPGTDLYGRAFEHFLMNEVRAYLSYRGLDHTLSYWRTSTGHEVDLIVGDMLLACEFKASRDVRSKDLRGMRTLLEEHKPGRKILVSRDETRRQTADGIDLWPWQEFCARLWDDSLLERGHS
ncbi:MAG: ATP-binding protein [Deltaproteobacteria bacterium]|nr:ATP-binding protein [Deltaproteobacteria bacterium]